DALRLASSAPSNWGAHRTTSAQPDFRRSVITLRQRRSPLRRSGVTRWRVRRRSTSLRSRTTSTSVLSFTSFRYVYVPGLVRDTMNNERAIAFPHELVPIGALEIDEHGKW